VTVDSEEGAEVMDFLNKCNHSQQLNGRWEPGEGIEIGGIKTARCVPIAD